MSPLQFFIGHRAEILEATGTHLTLVLIAMAIAVLIAVPLGMVIVQRPTLRNVALGIASVFQTIPSLALFGFLIPIPFIGGIGRRTAIVALVLYALLPILRNTYVGLTGIDAAVLQAAEAMGMTNTQILWRVRLPLALPGDSSRYPHSHDHHHRCSHHRSSHRRRRPRHLHLPRRSHGQRRRNPGRRHPGRPSCHPRRRSPSLAGAPPESSVKFSPILLSVTSANSASLRYLSIPAFSFSLFFSSQSDP